MATTGLVVVAGEISTQAYVDIPRVVRDTVRGIGYDRESYGFDGNTCGVITSIDDQSPDIAVGVDKAVEQRAGTGDRFDEVGAGDQGMMFGYACDETDDLMPMPIWLAHRLALPPRRGPQVGHAPVPAPRRQDPGHDRLRERRARSGSRPCSSPPSTPPGIDRDGLMKPDLIEHVIRPLLPEQFASDDVRGAGEPHGHVRARRPARRLRPHRPQDHRRHLRRHGPPRRRRVLGQGLRPRSTAPRPTRCATSPRTSSRPASPSRCEVQVAYAIGVAHPVSVMVETFGTSEIDPLKLGELVKEQFDLRPAAIIERLDLRRPIYQKTAAYGHFGRPERDFTWERTEQADAFKKAAEALA